MKVQIPGDIYEQYVLMKGMSVFSRQDEFIEIDDVADTPLMKAFLEDMDIQEMQICSTNIGMVRTYQKVFKKQSKEKV